MAAVTEEAKVRRREQQRASYAKGREKYLERARQCRQENREVLAEKQRAYHAGNREYIAERSAKWREANRETLAVKKRKYAAENRDHAADYKRERNYGVTRLQYDEMVALGGDGCWVCGKTNLSGRQLAVDHDHETGTVRGLLCSNCNSGLGKIGDSLAAVLRMAQYLQTNQPVKELVS